MRRGAKKLAPLPALLTGPSTVAVTVLGAPRTKKTHNQLWRVKGKVRVAPSRAWLLWIATARIRWRSAHHPETIWARSARPLLDWPVNCQAIFFRDANRGDAVGYYQGLADLLERYNVVPNDALLVSWDGSRLAIDQDDPRVEILFTPVGGCQDRTAYAEWVEAELTKPTRAP